MSAIEIGSVVTGTDERLGHSLAAHLRETGQTATLQRAALVATETWRLWLLSSGDRVLETNADPVWESVDAGEFAAALAEIGLQ